ncbi:hypothetical protein KIPB_001466 [Kipferlia bialata]|uniref:Uncharacterized protein n=1 Tax=Kipferlia bialata TaxID=797122 RepID=A0A391NIR5_9EUKA|nr:hypothetical protein KIPB_001466 [Kipferlia bialata]|eukprot:g1466.t1
MAIRTYECQKCGDEEESNDPECEWPVKVFWLCQKCRPAQKRRPSIGVEGVVESLKGAKRVPHTPQMTPDKSSNGPKSRPLMKRDIAEFRRMLARYHNADKGRRDYLFPVPLLNNSDVPDFPFSLAVVEAMSLEEVRALLERCEVVVPKSEEGASDREKKEMYVRLFSDHVRL